MGAGEEPEGVAEAQQRAPGQPDLPSPFPEATAALGERHFPGIALPLPESLLAVNRAMPRVAHPGLALWGLQTLPALLLFIGFLSCEIPSVSCDFEAPSLPLQQEVRLQLWIRLQTQADGRGKLLQRLLLGPKRQGGEWELVFRLPRGCVHCPMEPIDAPCLGSWWDDTVPAPCTGPAPLAAWAQARLPADPSLRGTKAGIYWPRLSLCARLFHVAVGGSGKGVGSGCAPSEREKSPPTWAVAH